MHSKGLEEKVVNVNYKLSILKVGMRNIFAIEVSDVAWEKLTSS